jgi:hypothetical protein
VSGPGRLPERQHAEDAVGLHADAEHPEPGQSVQFLQLKLLEFQLKPEFQFLELQFQPELQFLERQLQREFQLPGHQFLRLVPFQRRVDRIPGGRHARSGKHRLGRRPGGRRHREHRRRADGGRRQPRG